MELIDIVDENGNFTGEILDKEIAHDKNLLHNEVACLILNSKNQVLLQKRSANKRFDPNKWALCAGHVDSSESLKCAMIREIKEEIGVELEEKDFFIQKEELSEVKWFNIDDVINKLNLEDKTIVWGKEKIPLFKMLRNINIKGKK